MYIISQGIVKYSLKILEFEPTAHAFFLFSYTTLHYLETLRNPAQTPEMLHGLPLNFYEFLHIPPRADFFVGSNKTESSET